MVKPQKVKVMLKMTDRTMISATAIEDMKIPVKEVNILLNNVCYILKLEVNLMSMTRLNENDIYEMERLIIYRDLIQTYNNAMASKARTSKSREYCKNSGRLTSRDENYWLMSFTILQSLCSGKNDMFNLRIYDMSCQAGNEILH
ncbi:uncharacterized protein BDCG_17646 [Blastomyces dermatitidis ER-3]|uniref:Uncharacterized protein n=1 Tax=Ajellomyces dermatitidis (strain ER-3 / ATCC MYA-2586) TaxID=559297 RepID=A0ABX2VZK5_AJEDR|nr:uncharacterized protein BDCG_17646 [Blastomyces dermatitidis ER-3]OAT02574.1 hypothetical protein BDCG_17646 [Blastomyces dermatitidis ER-3]